MTQAIQLIICKIPAGFTPKLSALHPRQRQRAEGYTGQRLLEYVASRQLIDSLLDQGWQIDERDPTNLHICNKDLNSQRKISLSHSNEWLAVAFAPDDKALCLGVDIEKRRGNWSPEQAAFFCNETQCQEGLALTGNKQADFFTQLWTQKEAYYKATQKPFANKNFNGEPNFYLGKLNEEFFVSVYSDPALRVKTNRVELASR